MQLSDPRKYVTSLMGRNPGESDPKSRRGLARTQCATVSYARHELPSPPTDVTNSDDRLVMRDLAPKHPQKFERQVGLLSCQLRPIRKRLVQCGLQIGARDKFRGARQVSGNAGHHQAGARVGLRCTMHHISHRYSIAHADTSRSPASVAIPSFLLGINQWAVNLTVNGVWVRSKVVPEVTEIRSPHPERIHRPSSKRHILEPPHTGHSKPSGHRNQAVSFTTEPRLEFAEQP